MHYKSKTASIHLIRSLDSSSRIQRYAVFHDVLLHVMLVILSVNKVNQHYEVPCIISHSSWYNCIYWILQ